VPGLVVVDPVWGDVELVVDVDAKIQFVPVHAQPTTALQLFKLLNDAQTLEDVVVVVDEGFVLVVF
jgi:hypothetical protein